MRRLILILFNILITAWVFSSVSWAATYYVATDGNDSRTTTQAQVISTPWLTIQHCADEANDGDTCFVRAGTYNERVTVTDGGVEGSYIIFATYQGENAVMRGFTLTSVSYVKVIGFEITHINATYAYGISISGTGGHLEILNNNIHHVSGKYGILNNSGTNTYVSVRGNTIAWTDRYPESEPYTNNGYGYGILCAYASNHWLVEYNTFVGCFFLFYGGDHIWCRNNFLHTWSRALFDDAGSGDDGVHMDLAQAGSDGVDANCHFHTYESNIWGDNGPLTVHSKGIFSNNTAGDDSDLLARGNIIYNLGDSPFISINLDRYRIYNNSIYDGCQATNYNNGSIANFQNGATGGLFINNIGSETSDVNRLCYIDGTSAATATNNVGHDTTNVAGQTVSSDDPLFVNPADGTRNFELQSGSPARNAGRTITTIVSATGSGTSFDVTAGTGGLFLDGWGMTTGDFIKVGTTSVTVTGVSTDTITVSSSVSWTQNVTGVYWRNQTETPDIGAYEYKAAGYTLTGTWSLSGGIVTVVPNDATLVRFVEVFEDGVPKGTDFTSPYTVSGIGSGTVTAKLYSLYASATPVITATNLLGPTKVDGLTITGGQIK